MKKNLILVLTLGITVLLFSGCSTLMDICFGGRSPIAPVTDRAERRIGMAFMDATGISDMQAGMVASMVYMQVFVSGGYAGGYDDYSEGQGVVWEVTSKQDGEEERFEIERAFLKSLDDGSQWWLLRHSSQNDEIIAEALLDTDYQLLKFRYRDPEYDRIREWTPQYEKEEETPEETDQEAEESYSKVENYSDAMIEGDYTPYVKGSESVTVPAGTFETQYARVEVDYTESDPETGEPIGETDKLIYEWWISEEVPGNMVRYSWSRPSEGVTLTGHLKAITTNRQSQLGSF